jgi:hypothetical protein
MTPRNSLLSQCNLDAHKSWQHRRVAPAYVRGLPSWVWQSAMHSGAAA